MRDRSLDRRLVEAIHAAAAQPEPDDGSRSILAFEVAGVEHAVDAGSVEAITRAGSIATVPYGPRAVLGVASVRGRMRLVLDAGGASPATGAYLVVLQGDGQLALLADRIFGVRRVEAGSSVDVLDPERLLDAE